jgi:hypothetical protein
VVNVILIIVDVAARRRKNLRESFWSEMQSWKKHLAHVRGCILGSTFCKLRGTIGDGVLHLEGTVAGIF